MINFFKIKIFGLIQIFSVYPFQKIPRLKKVCILNILFEKYVFKYVFGITFEPFI